MSRYQYETSPRKVKTDYETVRRNANTNKQKVNANSKNKKVKATKIRTANRIKVVFFVLIGFMAFFTISYRNAIIDSKYAEIKTLKSNLALVEKENEQLEAGIESSLNLNYIQEQAENLFGMKKISNDQIKYVDLPKADYIESGSEKVKMEKDDYYTKIINFITNLFK